MTSSNSSCPARSLRRSTLCRSALGVLGLALTFAAVPLPCIAALEGTPLHPLANKAPKMPLKGKFEKVTEGENGPYILKLKNTSKEAVTAHAKILLSVAFHADSKARILPEQTVKAGEVWTIPSLAANDKVIITAEGFEPLELTVP